MGHEPILEIFWQSCVKNVAHVILIGFIHTPPYIVTFSVPDPDTAVDQSETLLNFLDITHGLRVKCKSIIIVYSKQMNDFNKVL